MMLIALALVVTGLFQPPDPVWRWPVDSAPLVVRDFVAPETPWGPGHRGIDVAARAGTRVIAPVSGTIHFSGDVAGRGVVTIRTPEGHLVSMEPVAISVDGKSVRAGRAIGHVAHGHCAGGCLHIGLRVEGEYRSPARELGILRRAILAR